jgi:hypothetical protein
MKTKEHFEYTSSKITVLEYRSCCEANTFPMKVTFTCGSVPFVCVPFTFPRVEFVIWFF